MKPLLTHVHKSPPLRSHYYIIYSLDTVTDGLIKLGMEPRKGLLEISILSLNDVIIRPTKIMNNLLKDCKTLTFKVFFQHQKSTESF
jgi:hypothetical protein